MLFKAHTLKTLKTVAGMAKHVNKCSSAVVLLCDPLLSNPSPGGKTYAQEFRLNLPMT